ncbi:hypothetical protein BaRGS_00014200 [Batillaria attramentaria]|uniref:Uncharacterized protein n=1 Tax=Batillaria attramentaria TaxID=370345 RepID=A0ABD0L621_9CAEN
MGVHIRFVCSDAQSDRTQNVLWTPTAIICGELEVVLTVSVRPFECRADGQSYTVKFKVASVPADQSVPAWTRVADTWCSTDCSTYVFFVAGFSVKSPHPSVGSAGQSRTV